MLKRFEKILVLELAFFFLQLDGLDFASLRRVREFLDLSQLSSASKLELLESRAPGRNVKLEAWELSWAKTLTAAQDPRSYLIWLKNVARITQLVSRPQRIFYPGIGPGPDGIDLYSVLIAFPNAREVIGIDLHSEINFSVFKKIVKFDAQKLLEMGIVSNFKFEQEGELSYIVEFNFLGQTRRVKIYFGKDANYFFPPELERGYDAIYTRWTFEQTPEGRTISDRWLNPLKDELAWETREKWLKFLNPDAGFLILDSKDGEGRPFFDQEDNPFWDAFLEVNLAKTGIDRAVIANYRIAHLLVLKGRDE